MAISNNTYKHSISMRRSVSPDIPDPRCVEVYIRMDSVYAEMIESISLDPNGPKYFENGCMLFVFSGAMFEAWINYILRKISYSHETGHDNVLLALIEKNQIAEKIKFIQGRHKEITEYLNIPLLNNVIEFRNRLMHFKDKPTSWTDDSKLLAFVVAAETSTTKEALFDAAPNPRIYDEIVDLDLPLYCSNILKFYNNLIVFENALKL